MKLLKRYKDINRKTIGYATDDSNNTFIDVLTAQSCRSIITNAYLLSTGEFRANQGESIETVVSNKNLEVRPNTVITHKASSNINVDYYGKDFINICKRIRRYAIQGNLVIDSSKHKSNNGNNVHLFNLIRACGITLENFIKGYLSVLQPYSLTKFQEGRKLSKDNIWLSDIGYGISLIIKINSSNEKQPIVVSFHESNARGRFMSGCKNFSDKPCAVLLDSLYETRPNLHQVTYTVQRGFIRCKVQSLSKYYNNGVALVKYDDISTVFNSLINDIFNQLLNNYRDENIDDISAVELNKKDFESLSFMSIGYNTVNNICLLLDLYSQYTDKKSRIVLVELTNNIVCEMPDYRLNELKLALYNRYEGTNNNLYYLIKDLGDVNA